MVKTFAMWRTPRSVMFVLTVFRENNNSQYVILLQVNIMKDHIFELRRKI